MDNSHFKEIFRFIILITVLGFGYAVAVTFIPIPKENAHIVDITLGFLFGTALSSGIGYLLGGNPLPAKRQPENSATLTTSTTILDVKDNERDIK